MRAFWQHQLASVARLELPDTRLVDAYDSGFVETQIARSGNHLDTGVNGYESEFSHDVVGILTNLFTQGDFSDAHALLTEARNVVGDPTQYVDGLWTYSVPWAVYLLKTGDLRLRQGELLHRRPARSDAAQHRGRRARARGRPDGSRRHDGGDQRHRHTGRVDPGRRGGAPRSGRLPLPGRARRGHASRPPGPSRQYQSLLAATDAALSANDRRPITWTISLALCSNPTMPTAVPTPRTPTGRHRSTSGPGRARCSEHPSTGQC